ncbi:MAG: hypothetical protein PHV51_10935 [Methanosarcinaceae archaeon]|nr:hypothetical protein [Methanosarcinaceae archaeon]
MSEKIKPTNKKVRMYRDEYSKSSISERNSMKYGYVFRTDTGDIEECYCINTGHIWKFLTYTCYPVYSPDDRYLGYHDKTCVGEYSFRQKDRVDEVKA